MPEDDKVDELQAQRDRLDQKRGELAQLSADRNAAVNNVADELQKAQLDAEERRLDAELSEARDGAKPETIRAGNERNLEVARAQMRAATEEKPPPDFTPPQTPKPNNGGNRDGK